MVAIIVSVRGTAATIGVASIAISITNSKLFALYWLEISCRRRQLILHFRLDFRAITGSVEAGYSSC